ncbi:MAG: universal stress protein [Desulfocucumaceae bacterium]
MYQKILVPLDGSERASAAAGYAMDLAKLAGAGVEFLHVIPIIPVKGEVYGKIKDDIEADGRRILRKAEEEFGSSGVSITTKMISSGDPPAEICRVAKEGRFDLIVLGSRGLGEFTGYLLGSVSNRVVRHAHCHVLVIK